MSKLCAIGVVRKNALEEVRVSLDSYRGHHLLDVRTYADFHDDGGERKPTKKGISLQVERIGELIAALQAAQAEAGRLGLLRGETQG